MKNKSFLSLFLFLSALSYAQQKDKEYKWQMGLQANTIEKLPSVAGLFIPDEKYVWGSDKNKSYSLGFTVNHFIKENISIRLKADYLNRNIIQAQGDHSLDTMTNGANPTERAEITQKDFYFAPGLQWNVPYKNTNVFYGMHILFNKYGKIKIDYHSEAYSNNIINNAFDRIVSIPGGYSFGIGSFWGINFNLSNRISFGTELSCDFMIYSVIARGETTNTDTIYYYYPAFPTETESGHHDNTTEKYGILSIKGTLKISFLF